MRPLLGILLQTLRHAAVGVAVVAVLMMTLRVHLHGQADDGHGHGLGVELSLGGSINGEPGSPANPDVDDPDGCGYCHCPAAAEMIAELPSFVFHDQVAGLARLVQPAVVPDSRSYPPDPPPVRLN
ncbi:MAG: hypothetical protein L6R48_24525 [Planctomycetes bacterium]|nr:hypothetical protein [Planctomycetota bacterium]